MEMTEWFDTNCHYIVPECTRTQRTSCRRARPSRNSMRQRRSASSRGRCSSGLSPSAARQGERRGVRPHFPAGHAPSRLWRATRRTQIRAAQNGCRSTSPCWPSIGAGAKRALRLAYRSLPRWLEDHAGQLFRRIWPTTSSSPQIFPCPVIMPTSGGRTELDELPVHCPGTECCHLASSTGATSGAPICMTPSISSRRRWQRAGPTVCRLRRRARSFHSPVDLDGEKQARCRTEGLDGVCCSRSLARWQRWRGCRDKWQRKAWRPLFWQAMRPPRAATPRLGIHNPKVAERYRRSLGEGSRAARPLPSKEPACVDARCLPFRPRPSGHSRRRRRCARHVPHIARVTSTTRPTTRF